MGKGKKLKLFYAHPDHIGENELFITGSEAHHALHVMRLSLGSLCEIFDGTGTTYKVKLSQRCDRQQVRAVILERTRNQHRRHITITLAQAIPQKYKFDYIVEKATELGVGTIIPIRTARTINKISKEKIDTVLERWRTIIIQTAKQCRQFVLPDITSPQSFRGVLKYRADYDFVLIPSLRESTSIHTILSEMRTACKKKKGVRVLLLIGPEGGFTAEELLCAKKNNARAFTLGKTILKTDTAMMVTVGMIQSVL